MHAEVILSSASKQLDKIFDYKIPGHLKDKIQVGHQVLIPFGKRQTIGYVVGFTDKALVFKLKDIIAINSPDPLFDQKQVELVRFMSSYYKSFFITALRLIMPPGTKQKEKSANVKRGSLRSSTIDNRDSKRASINVGPSPILTTEQQEAFDKILESLKTGRSERLLLFGVTGSGKTEVYMQAIAECVKDGKSAIILVPEIVLTPQIIERFKERFEDHLAVLHSDKTIKQRDAEWWRIYHGEAQVVLGTRSALFAPVKNLGLIVMDEEYETSYKQDKSPRYHTRVVAEKLAETHNAVLILGSATPSIETFYRAQSGNYSFAELPKRIDDRPLPPVEVVDLKKERGILSNQLKEEIQKTLDKSEKIILFLNRRGFFRVSFCENCGESIKCPNCSVPLILHQAANTLECSHCDYKTSAKTICPACHSTSLSHYGLGTQRIEKEVGQLFKKAKILRIDRDSTKKRGSHEVLFSAFAKGPANVLIGTQMVVKGMDLTEVTLVGVVNADVALNIPDFRAAEHTFQSLTQAAGRAGRHHLPGKVIIQTYNPEHYAIANAAKHDYKNFYDTEIKFREELFYPPFSKLINIEIAGEEKDKAAKVALMSRRLLQRFEDKIKILGPAKAPIEKLRGNHRPLILLKSDKSDALQTAVDYLQEKVITLSGTKVIVDVDPISFL